MYAVVNEALRVVEERHVIRTSDIDIGSVYGYGFPAYKGGKYIQNYWNGRNIEVGRIGELQESRSEVELLVYKVQFSIYEALSISSSSGFQINCRTIFVT